MFTQNESDLFDNSRKKIEETVERFIFDVLIVLNFVRITFMDEMKLMIETNRFATISSGSSRIPSEV
jgi:hypothetical protein